MTSISCFWREAVAVLTDLPGVFNCIGHELLIAKLNVYGFNNLSLIFMCSYVLGKKQKSKINSSFSCSAEISLLLQPRVQSWDNFYLSLCMWPLLDIRDLVCASFAHDTSPYTSLCDMIHILEKFEKGIHSMFDWFSENFLKASADNAI